MKFKQRAFRMRIYNQQTLEQILDIYAENYNRPEILSMKISPLMNKWAIEFDRVTNEDKE